MLAGRLAQWFWSAHSRTWDDALADGDVADHVVELVDRLLELVPPGAVVLDLGCGTGNHTLRVIEGDRAAIGVDLAPGMLAAAKAKGAPALVRADLAGPLPFAGGSVDGVLVVYVAQFLELDPLVGELRRVLRPGGGVLLEVPQPQPGRRDLSGLSLRYRTFQAVKRVVAGVGLRLGVVRWHSLDDVRGALEARGLAVVDHRVSQAGLAVVAVTAADGR